MKEKMSWSSMLAACCLKLAARGLKLAAWSLNRLVLDACGLRLAACGLWLEAWRLDLDWVTVFDTPFIMYFIGYDPPPSLVNIWFSAGHMLHS